MGFVLVEACCEPDLMPIVERYGLLGHLDEEHKVFPHHLLGQLRIKEGC